MTRSEDAPQAGDDVAWHSLPPDRVLELLDTGPEGLSSAAARERRDAVGPNELREAEQPSLIRLFGSQFRSGLIYLLVVAVLVSLGVGLLPGAAPNYVDAGLILLILLANGVFGFVQDYRAERSIAALRERSTPEATVRRDGEKRTIDATAVVPGDVVYVEGGDAIPADARLIEASSLETDESALTGESAAVEKSVDPVEADRPLAERPSMIYMQTNAVAGRGTAVVVATGMDTEVGGIATQLAAVEEGETPFEAEVDELGRRIGLLVFALVVVIAGAQAILTAAPPVSILLVAVSLAVAAVPEGLPAVVTLTLALGSRTMLSRNALVRRLSVVESLGAVDAIVTDKTGTLTENQMTVTRLAFGGAVYGVTGTGLSPTGEFRRDGEPVDPAVLAPLLRCGAICNNAERAPDGADRAFYGDPTEVAVLVAAEKAEIDPGGDRRREIPFSSARARMTVVVDGDPQTAYTKGAPSVVLERCDRELVDGEVRPLTDDRREAIRERTTAFANEALRVLGFARREGVDPEADPDRIERDMVFLGLQGMIDPPRAGVEEAVADCRRAGIRVVMATGDNPATAAAIGAQIGFDPTRVVTGREVEALSDDALGDIAAEVEVFARMAPAQKVRIMEVLRASGHDVAMTGDGVNDAPALRNADVGIAMGRRGTDVAKQAADVVLLDDDFTTIRDAIAEGRGIFDNIRKFVNYLLSANAGEVLVVFLGVLLGGVLFPGVFAAGGALVLTPVMLLWLNMVTDGFPALALGADPHAPDVLDRPPRGEDDPVIDRRMLLSIAAIGAAMTVTGLALFFVGLSRTRDLVVSQSLLFTFLVAVEMIRIQVIRARYDHHPLSNRYLVAAVLLSFGLQLAVLYTPLAGFFDVVPLSAAGWSWIGAAFVAFLGLAVATDRLLDRLPAPLRDG